MNYLIFETSSSRGLVSILDGDRVLTRIEVPFGVRESAELVPVLEQALKKHSLSLNDFKNIILGIGPGSFTGLRIGASVAKALSFAKKIPIIGISSLKTFDPLIEGPFGILLDAKLHGIYLQKGIKSNDRIYYEEEAKLYSPEALVDEIQNLPLLMSSQIAPLDIKLKGTSFDTKKLKESSPSPIQMLYQALQQPVKNHRQAQDLLDLNYFDAKES
ncbi:MAG: hypothetical protein S4CHLAM7_01810 [Chlamydiae bacterium]|nr:hypothetical protein [Chlamydiota bacterium]